MTRDDPRAEATEAAEPAWEDVEEVGPVEVDLDCENCGAALRWDPVADALACEHCGHTRPVPRAEGTILERPLDAAEGVARGLGVEVRASRCQSCGARVRFGRTTTSTACVFCGSPNVLPQEASRNQIRPESLVPLDVGAAKVEEAFRRWIRRLWFRPNALRLTRAFEAAGVYVPAWTFDARVRSEWSADSGTYYWVTVPTTVIVNGKPRVQMQRVRKIRWRPAWGEREDAYDDLQIVASGVVRGALAEKLGAFDTAELVPYRPEYLAGWRAEEYEVDLEQGWELARERIDAMQRARCAGDVPGDTHRDLRVANHVSDVRWKHVLLPMWTLTYEFRRKRYAVLIHGQSGRIVGEAPYSWVKILLAVLAVLALAGIAVVVAEALS